MNEVIFSHRPLAGVSVAATNEGNRLLFAVSLVNDGISKKHLFHSERRDTFSRSVARNILRGRLAALAAGSANVNLGIVFETDMSAREFMARFRKTFKPTVDESDTFLSFVTTFGGTEVRGRLSAEEIYNRVVMSANEVVAGVTHS